MIEHNSVVVLAPFDPFDRFSKLRKWENPLCEVIVGIQLQRLQV